MSVRTAASITSIHVLNAGIWLPGRIGTLFVLLLFGGVVSVVALLTVAVFESVPADATGGALNVRLITGAAPTGSVATVHVTVPATLLQVQPVPEALTNVEPAGRVSTTETVLACEGPLFVTASVYVIRLLPKAIGALVFFTIDRSVETAKFTTRLSSVADRHWVALAGSRERAADLAFAAAFDGWPVEKIMMAFVCPGARVIA
jgi:hypothetical protein